MGFPNPSRVSLASAIDSTPPTRIQPGAERPKQKPNSFSARGTGGRVPVLSLSHRDSPLASISDSIREPEERQGNRPALVLPASSVGSSSQFIPALPADSPDRVVVRSIPRLSLSLWFALDLRLLELRSASSACFFSID